MEKSLTILQQPSNVIRQIEIELARDPILASERTRTTYRYNLIRFEKWREGRTLSRLLVKEYITSMRDKGLAASSINSAISSLRWWARRISEMALESVAMSKEQRDEMALQMSYILSIRSLKVAENQRGRYLEQSEIDALISVCLQDNTPKGARDAGLFSTAFMTGLRKSELAGLDFSDVVKVGDKEAIIHVRHGKGDKPRVDFICNNEHGNYYDILDNWLAIRGDTPGALFPVIARYGYIIHENHIGKSAMPRILEKRAEQAGVKNIMLHDLRRTFCSNMLDSKADVALVARLMGHANLATLPRYDKRPEEMARRAVREMFSKTDSKIGV